MNHVKWAYNWLGKDKWKFWFAFLLTITFDIMITFEAQILGDVIDNVLKPAFGDPSVSTGELISLMLPSMALVLVTWLTVVAVRYFNVILFEQAGQTAIRALRLKLYEKLGQQTRSFYMKNRSGSLLNICTGDLDIFCLFLRHTLFSWLEAIVMLIAVLVIFIPISWKYTLCMLVITPASVYATTNLAKRVRPIFAEAREQLSRLNTVVQENISGNRVVKAFTREPFEYEKFEKENLAYRDINIKSTDMWLRYSPITDGVANLMNVLSTLLGALLVILGDISVGEMTVLTGLSWMLNDPMNRFGFLVNDTQRFFASMDRITELYYSRPEIASPEENAYNPDTVKGDIHFNHVGLSFDGVEVLKDIDFTIKAGQKIGFMGPTGSGKTSVMNLVSRFVDATSGSVEIDGVDVRQYDLQKLRISTATTLQDVFLFSDTVESNIAYGVPDTPMENVIESATIADAHKFVSRLVDGYDTIVGERGMGLSGGQKQRIALARALAVRSPILILDDTTSAVDLETEQYIYDKLRQRNVKSTTLIVGQRISSVKDADHIYIIEDGRISEHGTHKELLEKKGYYYRTYLIQQGLADKEVI